MLIFCIRSFGLNNVIDSTKMFICNDSIFRKYTRDLKVYVWKEKLEKKSLYSELYALRKMPRNKVKTEVIYDRFKLCEFSEFPLSAFCYKKTKKERKLNGIRKGKCAIIKISDFHKFDESTAYCLIRVYARKKFIDYNFFLKKIDNTWVIDEKYVISDFII